MSFSFKPADGEGVGKSFNFGGSGGVEDPLAGVEYSDDLAVDSAREMSALQDGFAKRAKAERARFNRVTDSEYWFAVCFESREEKDRFLKAVGVHKKMMGDKYLDGRKLAKILGIDY